MTTNARNDKLVILELVSDICCLGSYISFNGSCELAKRKRSNSLWKDEKNKFRSKNAAIRVNNSISPHVQCRIVTTNCNTITKTECLLTTDCKEAY